MERCMYCDEHSYFHVILSCAPWTHLELDNISGDVTIIAHGDNDCSYQPKFCPECGRKLIRIGVDIDEW